MSLEIGPLKLKNRALLAPMSGVSDLPMRKLAHEFGAGLVVSEMMASKELARARRDMLRRLAGSAEISPLVVQLAGREAQWMALGAKIAADAGAQLIDINMGCPARTVTGGMSGAALMRNPCHALKLIEATIAASSVPVSVKMRLGWDEDTLNAPILAKGAEELGAVMVTVHGRTRSQFYKGKADWQAVHKVRDEVSVPLIVNGDCQNLADAETMLAQSGADGVMIGRGAYGRPWIVGAIGRGLAGDPMQMPDLTERMAVMQRHYAAILAFYEGDHGVRIARKHLGWYLAREVDNGILDGNEVAEWRRKLLGEDDYRQVMKSLLALADQLCTQRRTAA